jgi:hypothetical protein
MINRQLAPGIRFRYTAVPTAIVRACREMAIK